MDGHDIAASGRRPFEARSLAPQGDGLGAEDGFFLRYSAGLAAPAAGCAAALASTIFTDQIDSS